MFKIEYNKEGEDARTGTLALPTGREISTPAMLLYTRRGGALHLTPDLLETLQPEAKALQLNVFNFVSTSPTLKQFNGTAREFLAIDPNFAMVATSRDPCIYEFQGALRQSTDEAASISSFGGSMTVTPEQYMETAAQLGPDVIVALSDEIPSDSKRARAATSVDRTFTWLQRCLAAPKPENSCSMFACVQGAQYLDYRQKCAAGLEPYLPSIDGICIGGMGTGESPQQRQEIVEEVLKHVPKEKARMISSVGTPEEVLAAVSQGIDLFDLSYINDLTEAGYALNFPVSPEEEASMAGNGDEPACSGADDTKMNLWAAAYRKDPRPFVPGCTCLACTDHTRSYVHHLLQAHEMSAQVFLEAHNTAHYLKFFAAVRRAVAAGKLEEYKEWFLGRKQKWIMGMSAAAV